MEHASVLGRNRSLELLLLLMMMVCYIPYIKTYPPSYITHHFYYYYHYFGGYPPASIARKLFIITHKPSTTARQPTTISLFLHTITHQPFAIAHHPFVVTHPLERMPSACLGAFGVWVLPPMEFQHQAAKSQRYCSHRLGYISYLLYHG